MADADTRLARRLTFADAVLVGLGSMIGAGVFVAIGAAARVAGNALVIGLALAALVAYCNATSSAQLAALYPESGGAYVYGRRRLGPAWGFLAGWCFVIGKLASCAAMALTFAHHAAPDHARPIAIGAVVALTALNLAGIKKSARVTQVIVVLVLAILAAVVAAILLGGTLDRGRLYPLADVGAHAVLQAAGLLFFAFAGYARLATLGEEVIDPARTIPRAIPLALGITLAIYAVIAISALLALDAADLGTSAAPLAAAVEAGRHAWLAPVARAGAAIASLGVLLSLVLGISRTLFAMADQRDLPRVLAAVHPRTRVPHRAELAVGAIVIAVVAVADVRGAIGFSSFAVLLYYAIANAAALTLAPGERRWPRALAGLGLAGCLVIAGSLPRTAVIAGLALVVAGAVAHVIAVRVRARDDHRR